MYLKRLSLTNFRNFTRLDMDVPRRSVVLVGDNAQGKTSVLEAVYFLAALTSFQTNADRQMVNFLEARNSPAVARIVGEYARGSRNHKLEVRLILDPVGVGNGQRLRKELLLDGVKKQASDAVGKFSAVVFVPQMSQIIEGGPDERRRHLNLALAQAVPAYAGVLSDYGKALEQRNALLKALNERGGNADQLEVWDETLARLGAQIVQWRIAAVQELEKQAARIHFELTHGAEVLRLAYEPAYDPLPKIALKLDAPADRSNIPLKEVERGFLERLRGLRSEEISRGVTTIGPHRDEMRFLANQIDLGDYGSRGQVRTALLSLKLAEAAWIQARTGQWPVILLDEVMAELDLQRRADLLKYLGQAEQSLLTAADLRMFTPEFVESAKVWHVKNGKVEA
ncbi:MAG: DNA replication and repair protein RecF [Anaerolineaceae bacterium]|nr:DNA replication/repair protein RecF [Chloroflexota bacterium]WKZ53807.1 MAG: DNA replication/repair protein RecF [Anaerolineales bacterium]GIK09215.1 MAG: DNA replication and repair protein RecF [Chloroflexota bacterium]GJQ38875.1 MAG: DNA replication and repair protein RecF [Anaerolineaceae bacterium]HMM97993.1 DNA replication/repair protein RecF [Anaerolineales bacterium]